jgi:guanylate kinase
MFTPRVFIVSGPSGVGKSTIIRQVLEREPDMRLSVSITTRRVRPGEVEGRDYFFVSLESFEDLIRQGEFLEWARVYDNYYGTSRSHIEGILSSNHHALLDLDTQGALQIRRSHRGAVLIFIRPPDIATLETRLRNRGTESEETLAGRLAWADHEIGLSGEYDHAVVNDRIEQAVEAFLRIVEREKQRAEVFAPRSPAREAVLDATVAKAVAFALERVDQEALVRTLGQEVKQAVCDDLAALIRERLAQVIDRELEGAVAEAYRSLSSR